MITVSVYIIAFNEAEKIEQAIRSVLWADEIIVADSFSSDGTADIAASMGATVVQIPFNGFGDLRNQAIAHCSCDWIFSLDADERCIREVQKEIRSIADSENSSDVYFVPRKNFFMGRWIRHSGYYPDYRQPQLFKKGAMRYKSDLVHEGYELLTPKPPGYLKNAVWQMPFRNLDEILRKANRYSALGAEKMAAKHRKAGMITALTHAAWAFVHHFIVKKGILDGWAGFVIAFGNFEGTFYKYAKLYEKNSDWRFPEE